MIDCFLMHYSIDVLLKSLMLFGIVLQILTKSTILDEICKVTGNLGENIALVERSIDDIFSASLSVVSTNKWYFNQIF